MHTYLRKSLSKLVITESSKSDSLTGSRMLYSLRRCCTLDLIPDTLYTPSTFKPMEKNTQIKILKTYEKVEHLHVFILFST